MKAFSFEYDGIALHDLGFMLCKFDGGRGVETIQNGSEISFNTISTLHGTKHELASADYEDCLTATLQICKNLCDYSNDEEISLEDQRDIMRWLNRKGFHKFKLLDHEYSGIYFEASFNVSRIEMNGRVCGFELEMFTNRPFGVQEPVTNIIKCIQPGEKKTLASKSDEEGFIYPNMEITIEADGDLEIYSETEDRTMVIKGCVASEIITIEYPMISSTVETHKIQNDFNWSFFRIASSFRNRQNDFVVSLPCSISIKYSPIVKVGI